MFSFICAATSHTIPVACIFDNNNSFLQAISRLMVLTDSKMIVQGYYFSFFEVRNPKNIQNYYSKM